MDEVVELAFRALRVAARLMLQMIVEGLIEHLVSPLAELIAAIYRRIRDFLRVLFRFDVIAIPLATLAIVGVVAAPLFMADKALEWLF